MTSAERNERFILDEYRAHGLAPVLMRDGRPVSLTLARQFGLTPATTPTNHPTREAAE